MAEHDDGDRASNRLTGRGRPSSAFTGKGFGRHRLAERLGDLSRVLENTDDVQATLTAIVSAAADTIPGVEHASVSTIVKHREVHTYAATGELPRAVDQAQYDTGQGPCLMSLYERQTVRLSDLDTETRWPEFTARVRQVGLRSMLAIQLWVTGEDLGALNLQSTQPNAFTDESELVGLLFAAHAAVAMAGAREQAGLRTAVGSRDLIGQAKGILMERYKISSQDAFRLLVTASQAANLKLTTVADDLVNTGQMALRDR